MLATVVGHDGAEFTINVVHAACSFCEGQTPQFQLMFQGSLLMFFYVSEDPTGDHLRFRFAPPIELPTGVLLEELRVDGGYTDNHVLGNPTVSFNGTAPFKRGRPAGA
jgi:hypothetical protein